MIPTMTVMSAGVPFPPDRICCIRVSNWPPDDFCSTHMVHQSPAFSSVDAASSPAAPTRPITARPVVTSSSGPPRRVSIIRAPAAIAPPTAIATAIGRIRFWTAVMALSPYRPGDFTDSHSDVVFFSSQISALFTSLATPFMTPL
jgi:hypothetical protein